MSYCTFVNALPANTDNPNKHYHDFEYGFPIMNDDALFGRLLLEINQAGLSWTTVLKKKLHFEKAYDQFSIAKIARYTEKDRERLLNDAGIIRNKLKINAAIENAKIVLALQEEFGSFNNWLDHHHPDTKENWTKLFKKTFRFTGGEIVHSFLMSCGYLDGAHEERCPIYARALAQHPKWASTSVS